MRSRNWCFTYFPHKEPVPAPVFGVRMQFLIFQKEKCPSTGTIHLQGYVEFKESLRLTQVKTIMGHTTHLELRRGSQRQAIEYCKKIDTSVGESVEIFGKPMNQGRRSDLDDLHEAICAGHTKREILLAYKGSALRYITMIDKAMNIMYRNDKLDDKIIAMRDLNDGELLCIACAEEGEGAP